jgi:protein TonB
VRVNSGVQEAKLIRRVMPVYPKLAIPLRVTGAVHLAAIIGADGRIRELQVLSGHPLLVRAAVDAVREWVYQPTMLSGSPVEVLTDITVTFSLR